MINRNDESRAIVSDGLSPLRHNQESRQRGIDVVSPTFDKFPQLNAIDLAGRLLDDTNAHFGEHSPFRYSAKLDCREY